GQGASRMSAFQAVKASDTFRSANRIYFLIICHSLKSYNERLDDAGPVIKSCISSAREGEIVELPPGRYRIATPILAERGFTVRTQGKLSSMQKCNYSNAPDC